MDQIKQAIENDIKDDQWHEEKFNALLPFIRENDGKKIDGWFKKRLQKQFPEYGVRHVAGGSQIEFPPIAPGRIGHFLISYNGQVSLETYTRNNTWCQEKEHGRIAKNRAITHETMQLYCKHLNAVISAGEFLDRGNFDAPAHYSLRRLIPYEVKKRRD